MKYRHKQTSCAEIIGKDYAACSDYDVVACFDMVVLACLGKNNKDGFDGYPLHPHPLG